MMEEIINSPEYQKLLPYLFVIFGACILLLFLYIYLCFIGQRTILLIKEENRHVTPEQAWLFLIPFFNIYWNFVFMRRLVDSLNNEFYDRKMEVEENPTQKNGYFFAWSFLVLNLPLPAFIFFVSFLLTLVAIIFYIAKIVEHKKLLEQTQNLDYPVN